MPDFNKRYTESESEKLTDQGYEMVEVTTCEDVVPCFVIAAGPRPDIDYKEPETFKWWMQ